MEDWIGSLAPAVIGLMVGAMYAARRRQEKLWSRPDVARLKQHRLSAVDDNGVVFVDASGAAPALQARVLDGEIIVEAPGTQVLLRLQSFWARRTVQPKFEAVNLSNGFAAGMPSPLALALARHSVVRAALQKVLQAGGRVAVEAGAFVCVFPARGGYSVEELMRSSFDRARPTVLALEHAACELQRSEPALPTAGPSTSTSTAGSSFAVPASTARADRTDA